jgi:CubicO group peptidase (beta-lactamase class C family)
MKLTTCSRRLTLGLWASSCAAAAILCAGPTVRADKYTTRLEPALEKVCREERVPGLAVAVVEDGKLAYSRGFGLIKWGDATRPVTPETLFHMASVTKPFVATAVMQLMEQGKLQLDAPVTRYLPYFRLDDPRNESITVRHILTHTSGMPDVDDYHWDNPEYDDGSLERYVRSLGNQKLRWNPGTKFAYSNMAYEALGDLVSKVSGQSFEEFVQSSILEPLGMNSSTLLLKKADPSRLAEGHTRAKDGSVEHIKHYPYNRAHTPSSNLHSCASDIARWMIANLNGGELDGRRILKHSSHASMWKPEAETGKAGSQVGLSWFLDESKGNRLVSHAGGDDGFLTYLCMCPARSLGFAIMINCDHGPSAKRILETMNSAVLEGVRAP